jgi:hypothetical protein
MAVTDVSHRERSALPSTRTLPNDVIGCSKAAPRRNLAEVARTMLTLLVIAAGVVALRYALAAAYALLH